MIPVITVAFVVLLASKLCTYLMLRSEIHGAIYESVARVTLRVLYVIRILAGFTALIACGLLITFKLLKFWYW